MSRFLNFHAASADGFFAIVWLAATLFGFASCGNGEDGSAHPASGGSTGAGGATAFDAALPDASLECQAFCEDRQRECGRSPLGCRVACNQAVEAAGPCVEPHKALLDCQVNLEPASCDAGIPPSCMQATAFFEVCRQTDGGTGGCGRFPAFDGRCAEFGDPPNMYLCSSLVTPPPSCVWPKALNPPEDAGPDQDPARLFHYCCPG